jgi:hypothetical protein
MGQPCEFQVAAAAKTEPTAKEFTESVPRAVLDYGVRNGFWIVGSVLFTLLTQSGQLVLFQWNDYWASDKFNLGFRRNYLIAIALMLGSQGSKLLKGGQPCCSLVFAVFCRSYLC